MKTIFSKWFRTTVPFESFEAKISSRDYRGKNQRNRFFNIRCNISYYILLALLLLYLAHQIFMLAADYIFPPSTNFKFRIYEITVLDLEEKAKSICGDIEFLKNSHLAQIAKENARNFSKCDYCEKIRTDPGSNSTENDAAFAYLMGNKTLNILNWVRTLRSSSCRCSIIFIVTQQIYETHHKSVWGDLQKLRCYYSYCPI